MKQTNKDLQKELDEQKYYESEINGQDMSGKMEYCKTCPMSEPVTNVCKIMHEHRVETSQCAKSFKIMQKYKKTSNKIGEAENDI